MIGSVVNFLILLCVQIPTRHLFFKAEIFINYFLSTMEINIEIDKKIKKYNIFWLQKSTVLDRTFCKLKYLMKSK